MILLMTVVKIALLQFREMCIFDLKLLTERYAFTYFFRGRQCRPREKIIGRMKWSQNIETFFVAKKKNKSATGAGDSNAEMCVRNEHGTQSGMYKYADTIGRLRLVGYNITCLY